MTKQISVGNILIGGGAPTSIQSMTNTNTVDAGATIAQINSLVACGCEIVRLAVPGQAAVKALSEIIPESSCPLIADIHFDYRLALGAIDAGINAIRINPGNIGDKDKIRILAEKAGDAGVPIRVGANSGSLPADIKNTMQSKGNSIDAKAEALVESALRQCRILEEFRFNNIKVSLKSSSVPVTVKAYKHFSQISDYPLHLGVTEAGSITIGTVKSSIGIGSLLLDGIGDTLRVSLTAAPEEEIKIAKLILESIGIRRSDLEIISCPTCGRTEFDLIDLVQKVENIVHNLKANGKVIKINKLAVMGCVVNGPGEASDAELGIAGVKGGKASLFMQGKSIGVFSLQEALERLEEALCCNDTHLGI
jgi:(E)-4-hydroxy-3-methylbut-2-enyl-diphosphate synthase